MTPEERDRLATQVVQHACETDPEGPENEDAIHILPATLSGCVHSALEHLFPLPAPVQPETGTESAGPAAPVPPPDPQPGTFSLEEIRQQLMADQLHPGVAFRLPVLLQAVLDHLDTLPGGQELLRRVRVPVDLPRPQVSPLVAVQERGGYRVVDRRRGLNPIQE